MNDEKSAFMEIVSLRIATTLERIATAVEQWVLDHPGEAQAAGFLTGEPPLPTPEFAVQAGNPTVTVPLPPVAAPFQFTPPAPAAVEPAFRYQAGMNHAAGHKPLKENNRGLYCPTKLQDGTWCQFTVKAG